MKVYLVGAGPGDPELLTVRAQRLIQQADVLVYADSLIPPAIVALARPDCERIPTKHLTLEEIVPLMVSRAQANQLVVRLHSGDVSIYGAIAEQIEALRQAGVAVEVVPGIGSLQLAAARLQTEWTLPEVVQTVILTRAPGVTPMPEKLADLAAHRATLALYLSARWVDQAQAELQKHYPTDTLVAVCHRLGWPQERIWLVPLAEMAPLTHRENLTRTTLYVISPVFHAQGQRSRLYHPDHRHLFRP
ncbi:MAG: precorrin-4 C(11)-methyltransferase [Gloeomargarita sp. SKYBB_i_bin120]|nr:precorrin-4 C(11)-methyltransferase [Gloeomargarita sp. SKYG98]MCS7292475.1 precorrin-4 C(11)-methyltransferase [Gloeomargarita sp. SKYB120]MDW8178036.1 precorrin-4 C(11)-methyltransferase [Gloeomargarita sp. SKYBB_i_bin120]MDW8328131.1 precorrin-4 C(11)-methyltransferase [Anaerolineales bacterium]